MLHKLLGRNDDMLESYGSSRCCWLKPSPRYTPGLIWNLNRLQQRGAAALCSNCMYSQVGPELVKKKKNFPISWHWPNIITIRVITVGRSGVFYTS